MQFQRQLHVLPEWVNCAGKEGHTLDHWALLSYLVSVLAMFEMQQ